MGDIKLGDNFGHWTVVSHVAGARYEVECDCGTRKIEYASSLLNRKTVSCGCYRKTLRPQVGEVFNEWTVLEVIGRNSRCRCSCGVEKLVYSKSLTLNSKSCGHIRNTWFDEINKECSECLEVKPHSEFHKDRRAPSGLRTRCKLCVKNEHQRKRESRNTKFRENYKKNSKEIIARTSAYRKLHPEYKTSKSRVSKGGGAYDATLSKDDFDKLLKSYNNCCYICKINFVDTGTKVTWDHYKPIKAGGDHIMDNLRPACRSCNCRKHAVWPVTPEFLESIRESVWKDRNLANESGVM